MSAYGDQIYVVEVESDLTSGHWTMSEHGRLESAVEYAEALQADSGRRKAIPADRIRIREYELSATYRADGTLAIEPHNTGGVA